MATNSQCQYRVWRFMQADGNPAEAPIQDFEGDLTGLKAKYPDPKMLESSKDNGLTTSFGIQSSSDGIRWTPCGYPA